MIKEVRRKIQRQEYEYSLHAADQSVLRHIARREVEEAIESGGRRRHRGLPERQIRPKLFGPGLHESWEMATHSVYSSGPDSDRDHYGL